MSDNGNGSTEDREPKFPTGLVMATDAIARSVLAHTTEGQDFVDQSIRRHEHAEWGETPPDVLMVNLDQLLRVRAGLAGTMHSEHRIPGWLATACPSPTLGIATMFGRNLGNEMRAVITVVLFTGEDLDLIEI